MPSLHHIQLSCLYRMKMADNTNVKQNRAEMQRIEPNQVHKLQSFRLPYHCRTQQLFKPVDVLISKF